MDMDDPLTAGFDTGFDFRTGYGFIQADKAPPGDCRHGFAGHHQLQL